MQGQMSIILRRESRHRSTFVLMTESSAVASLRQQLELCMYWI